MCFIIPPIYLFSLSRKHKMKNMNKNIKMIALDLDGTLLQRDGTVSTHGLEVLRQLRQQNIKVMICSGRPYYSIQRIFQEPLYDYVGSYNGQILYQAKTHLEIKQPDLNESQIQHLLHYLNRIPMILSYSQGTNFVHATAPHFLLLGNLYQLAFILYHKILRKPYWPAKLMSSRKVSVTSNEKFCFASFHFLLQHLVNQLDPKEYTTNFVGNHWLEVQTAGISKGNALRKAMELEHLTQENVVAIGDGENDISMLEAAGIGIAMGNAMQKVKKIADEITLTCEQDGAIVWIANNILR